MPGILTGAIATVSSQAVRNMKTLVAVCQLTSTHDLAENFSICSRLISEAKEKSAKMVFLPECFDYVGRSVEETVKMATPENGYIISQYRELARKHKIWLSLGGFHEKNVSDEKRPFNTHLVLNEDGATVGKYRKLHLFDVEIPEKVRLMESEFSAAGSEMLLPLTSPAGNLALGICYDMRFPEMAVWQRKHGATILTYPSAFTVPTGHAHWEVLLRCRAIETQCYVVAAAQVGEHNAKRSSYGNAVIVDPWGKIIAKRLADQSIGLEIAEIDSDYVEKVRRNQPVLEHRRNDVYSIVTNSDVQIYEAEAGSIDFGGHTIPGEQIFLHSSMSFAFVNIKPVVPGHVLVASKRCEKRLTDLTVAETADLFQLAKIAQKMLQKYYDVSSVTVNVQDGPRAGQTVEHVHIHILPRRLGDFEGDEVYEKLATNDQDSKIGKDLRTVEQMAEEAARYKEFSSDP